MRDAIEGRELDDLRVDHEEAQLVGRSPVEDRQEHHVEPDALAGARRARDDDVRHARQVRVDGVAEDVAPEHDRERHVERLEAPVLDEVAQDHRNALRSFGSSKPMRFLPGIGATMRTLRASASARSSASPATLETFVPAAGETS